MQLTQILTFAIYYFVIFLIIFLSYKKKQSSTDFILGDRKLNFWLTALSAHASDMSAWLFLAYPSKIFLFGTFHAWTGIGLTIFMLINWTLEDRINKFENSFEYINGTFKLISQNEVP